MVRNRMPGGVRGSGGDPAAYSMNVPLTPLWSGNRMIILKFFKIGEGKRRIKKTPVFGEFLEIFFKYQDVIFKKYFLFKLYN
ncbi:MAG: hypothetical protein P8Y04_10555 [Desulfobulbaceae bacterium]